MGNSAYPAEFGSYFGKLGSDAQIILLRVSAAGVGERITVAVMDSERTVGVDGCGIIVFDEQAASSQEHKNISIYIFILMLSVLHSVNCC